MMRDESGSNAAVGGQRRGHPVRRVRDVWKHSLMTRLVGYFVSLVLITIGLASYLAYSGARDALETAVLNRLRTVATLQEGELRRWVDHQIDDLTYVATSPTMIGLVTLALNESVSEGDRVRARDELRRYLDAALRHKTDLQEMLVLGDLGGRIVVSTDQVHEGEYRPRDRFFVEGRERSYVSGVYPSPLTIEPTLTVSGPLRTADGIVLGVLAAHLNLTRINRIITGQTGLAVSGETYLVDRYNVLVSSDRSDTDRFLRGVHTEGINAAVSGIDSASVYTSYAGVPVIGAYRWIEDMEVALLVEVAQAEALAPARQIALTIWLTGLMVALALTVGTMLLARQIARPILGITRAAVRVSEGDLDARAPVATRDEIGVLARTFNDMTSRLRDVYDDLKREVVARTDAEDEVRKLNLGLEQRVRDRTSELKTTNAELESFAYSVSHDLRAPLRSIRGFSDALAEDYGDELEHEAKHYLQRIREGSSRMSNLIDALLGLSRVTRHKMEFGPVDLSAHARAVARDLRRGAPSRRVEFDIAADLSTTGDARLLRLVLDNLFSNAWKFTVHQEETRIEFASTREHGRDVFYVRDNGVGFNMAYAGKLFGAFQRLHREDQFEGTGIGLATVHRIIQRHHGEVWGESEEGRGATFYFTIGEEAQWANGWEVAENHAAADKE